MKKLLILILFAAIIFVIPYILPQMIKEKIFRKITGKMPGKFEVENIQLSWFSENTLQNVTWEYKENKVKLPYLIIDSSLPALFFEKDITYHFSSGEVYYKDKLLFDRVKAEPTLLYKNKKLTLSKPCVLTAGVVEDGVDAFTNHILIPPFSSKSISLHLSAGVFQTDSKNSLKLEGNLRLGTLKCGDNHLLTTILSLLREKTPTYISVECGIMPFIIQNGVASFERTHFLIDGAFEIVSLGTVNLMSDALNIHIGLTTTSLVRAFDLTSLPPGYMVPFYIKGTTHKPEIHIKEALKTIAALVLLEKIAPQNRIYPKVQSF